MHGTDEPIKAAHLVFFYKQRLNAVSCHRDKVKLFKNFAIAHISVQISNAKPPVVFFLFGHVKHGRARSDTGAL